MEFSLITPAFIAGLFTFLAPCTLPLVPGYLGFISGVSLQDIHDPQKAPLVRRKILLNGLAFIVGFTVVFIAFGTLAGFLGRTLVPYRIWLTRVGGVFGIIFGLFMLRVLKIPFLNKEKQFTAPKLFTQGKALNSFFLGAAFAFGWTPCVGPILGSILLLASTSTTALQGAFLLFIFSLGLAVPFLAIAIGIGHAAQYVRRITKYLNIISVVGGLFLIVLGILLLTNNFSIFISVAYRLFDFVNYEQLLDYL